MAKAVTKTKKTAVKSKPSVTVRAKPAPSASARKALKKSAAKPAPQPAGKVGALAAEQIAQLCFAFCLAVAEREHPFARFRCVRGGLAGDSLAGGFRRRFGRTLLQGFARGGRRRGLCPCGNGWL